MTSPWQRPIDASTVEQTDTVDAIEHILSLQSSIDALLKSSNIKSNKKKIEILLFTACTISRVVAMESLSDAELKAKMQSMFDEEFLAGCKFVKFINELPHE